MPRFGVCHPDARGKCVSSLDTDGYPAMEPIAFGCTPREAFRVARDVVAAHPRTTIEDEDGMYVSAICRTRVFRFKDRVQLEVDPDVGVIHFKSYSTLRWAGDDLNANRSRMEEIGAAIRAALPKG